MSSTASIPVVLMMRRLLSPLSGLIQGWASLSLVLCASVSRCTAKDLFCCFIKCHGIQSLYAIPLFSSLSTQVSLAPSMSLLPLAQHSTVLCGRRLGAGVTWSRWTGWWASLQHRSSSLISTLIDLRVLSVTTNNLIPLEGVI
jgi:hypothetical protein